MLTCITTMTLFAALAVPMRLTAQGQQQQTKKLPRYTVTDLGTLGGTYSAAIGVNNGGSVDGLATLPGDTAQHAFLWRNGVITDLGTLGGPNSGSVNGGDGGPNAAGKVVGPSETSTPDPLGEDFCGYGTHLICFGFLWRNGVMTPLPTLGGNNSFAIDINNRGQATGLAENTTPDPTCVAPQVLQFKPVIWEKGEVQELPTLSGDPDGVAGAMNDQGQAVGWSGTCSDQLHVALWQNGTVTDLGNLGGTKNNTAGDINNQGQVVGLSDLPGDTTYHAFLWTKDSGIRDLGTLPGDFSSLLFGINNKGQAAGFSCDINGNCRAVLWQNGEMTDLNTLIPAGSPLYLLGGIDINSRGQIVGFALQISSSEVHAFLATPSYGEVGSESATPAAPGSTSESPKVVLPENVRKLLQQRLRFGGRLGRGL
jgi:probable HAF family extracellular repeat protein